MQFDPSLYSNLTTIILNPLIAIMHIENNDTVVIIYTLSILMPSQQKWIISNLIHLHLILVVFQDAPRGTHSPSSTLCPSCMTVCSLLVFPSP